MMVSMMIYVALAIMWIAIWWPLSRYRPMQWEMYIYGMGIKMTRLGTDPIERHWRALSYEWRDRDVQ